MKLYAPKYYKSFKCIADRCEHSCCIGWEIGVDGEALEKYECLGEGYGDTVKNSISFDGDPHFKLCADDRCPHLNDQGLCKIIINLGEEYLCDICREHPRFYNYTDVAEVGLGMSCPEAARIILASSDYTSMEEIGETDADGEIEFNGRVMRDAVYSTLSDSSLCYDVRLAKIYADCDISLGDDEMWLQKLSELAYIVPIKSGMPDALVSFLSILVPPLLLLLLRVLYGKNEKRASKRSSILVNLTTGAIMLAALGFVLLISCQFRYCLLVIATESMTGEINKGDAVIYEKYTDQIIEEDRVIVFNKNDLVYVHRVIDVTRIDGQNRYFTKGDANDDADSGFITDADIIGVVDLKVPYVGYPTLWLRQAFK